jgi:hypothetical protein
MARIRSTSDQAFQVILDRIYHQIKNIRNSSEYNYWFLNRASMIIQDIVISDSNFSLYILDNGL